MSETDLSVASPTGGSFHSPARDQGEKVLVHLGQTLVERRMFLREGAHPLLASLGGEWLNRGDAGV